jgi:hypothetical protein
MRGYFYTKTGKLFYHCHNCGASQLFSTFLKEFDFNLYKEYNLEVFKDNMVISTIPEVDATKFISKVTHKQYDIFSSLPLVRNLSHNDPAYIWCKNRKLPIDTFEFYFADKFISWTTGHTDKFDSCKKFDHPRVIIPWRDTDNSILGYSARDFIGNQTQKYFRIFLKESDQRYFGIDRLDKTKKHYVLEGEIDSLMIPNAIAVANAKLHSYYHKNAVYIPDADRRNKCILNGISEMIHLGLKVCLLPDRLVGKDLNEFVCVGLNSDDILDIIDANTYQGLGALMKFTTWKKT